MLSIQTGTDNKILREKSKVVKQIDRKLIRFIREMEETMKAEKGVGLAAPQAGLNQRVIVVLLDNQKTLAMINPEIFSHSETTRVGEEGCLSLPGQWGNVERYAEINVRFLTEKGEQLALRLSDFNARVVQHEIDHLDGILFTDYLKKEADFLSAAQAKEREKL